MDHERRRHSGGQAVINYKVKFKYKLVFDWYCLNYLRHSHYRPAFSPYLHLATGHLQSHLKRAGACKLVA